MTERYEVGGTYTAYYDPTNPEEAFLMRHRSVLPWAFVGMPLVALMFMAGHISSNREMARMSSPRTGRTASSA